MAGKLIGIVCSTSDSCCRLWSDLGLLINRAVFGTLMAIHGFAKFDYFKGDETKFMEFMGLSPTISLALAVGAEFFCAIAVAIGLFSRLAAIPVMVTMLVAVFMFHGNDPWMMTGQGGAKEPALMYLIAFTTVLLAGPGRFSIDHLISKACCKTPAAK